MHSSHAKTNFVENHYYRLNQLLLSMLMLWPHQQSKFENIHHTFHFALLLSFVFFQLTSFLTSQFTVNILILVLSYITPALTSIVRYYILHAKRKEFIQIWRDIRECWRVLKNEMERDIIRQHSCASELFTLILLVILIVSFSIYTFIVFSPIILDVIFPLNETRPRMLSAPTEYFVDEETYFYPIACHWLICVFLCAFIIIATDSFLLTYVEHICGLLRISSYRIEHSIDVYALLNPAQKDDRIVVHNISTAVNVHRKAIECCEFLLSSFAPSIFLLIVIWMVSLSLNLFRLFRAIILLKNINEMGISMVLVILHFLIMFLGNYYGQKITDFSGEIFNNIYNTQWYKAPVKIQKLLLFIMKNTTKAYVLHIGFAIMVSLEGFSKLSSTAISYFTVIYSLL